MPVAEVSAESPHQVHGQHVQGLAREVDFLLAIGQEARAVYYRIKLEKVHVSSYSFSAGDPAGPVPVEQISLNYETITWTYARASGGEGSR